MDNQNKKTDTGSRPPKVAALFFLFVLPLIVVLGLYASWIYYVHYCTLPLGKEHYELFGVFGDSFGVVNALFSGLALVAIAITLFQTQKQIRLQQIELRQNTEELRGQKEQLAKHVAHLEEESVRNQFFRMLESWQDMIESTTYNSITGRAVFNAFANRFGRDKIVDLSDCETPEDIRDKCRVQFANSYNSFYRQQKPILSSYFRLLYHCIKFVHYSHVDDLKKRVLIDVLKAHLSTTELKLLMFHCLLPETGRLYHFVEHYDFLKSYDLSGIGDKKIILIFPTKFCSFDLSLVEDDSDRNYLKQKKPIRAFADAAPQ